MLQPLIQRARRGLQASRTQSIPAPVGGWNVREPLSNMPPGDAVIMENWFPEAHQVRVRAGAQLYAPINGVNDGTLMPYNGPNVSRLFMAMSGPQVGIYEVLNGSTSGRLVTLTTGRMSHTNFSTSGGNFLIAVNGADSLQLYNGTTWASITGVSVPAITGVPTNELAYVTVMKERLWFARNNSLSAWYLPVSSIGGALVELPLGTVFGRGGFLVAMANWSVDGGDGVDDYSVFVSSEGEVAIYRGSNPATIADWSLVGVYYIGEPLGRRCLTTFGGDLLFLCKIGLFPLSKALNSSTIDRRAALTDKINVAFAQAVASYGGLLGWQAVVFPGGPFVLVNIPTDNTAVTFEQYVMNTLTGSWCRFTGWNAWNWEVWDERLFYYGLQPVGSLGFGGVQWAWTGTSDFNLPINARCQQAFNYFQSRGRQKHMKLVRPQLQVDGAVAIQLGLDTDFDVNDFTSISSLAPTVGNLWDASQWDSATWASSTQVRRNWATVFAREFYAAAFRLQVSSASATVRWASTDFVAELGGVL